MRSIYGADPTLSGTVLLGGKKIENRSPAQAIANGIALCPEDRKEQGIIPTLSVGMNISISVLKRLRNAWSADRRQTGDAVDRGRNPPV